jgi:hypothetical protein
VVGVGVDGPPGVDVIAGPDLRPLHPIRKQPHPRRRRRRRLLPACRLDTPITPAPSLQPAHY